MCERIYSWVINWEVTMQKCSRCNHNMEQPRRRKNPICLECKMEKNRVRSRLRTLARHEKSVV